MKRMKYSLKRLALIIVIAMISCQNIFAATDGNNKVLIIGIDGLIYSVIDYASTPSIDELISNATYNMNGYGGTPSFSSTGWVTILTGVSSAKHGVTTNNSFDGNNFDKYPSIVSRIKAQSSDTKIASIVRDNYINDELNYLADYKYSLSSDVEVLQKSIEVMQQPDIEVGFVQFSSPKEVGEQVGFLLRDAQYVLAAQQIDEYVGELFSSIKSRPNYKTENWSIYLVSTHGGSPSGAYTGSSIEEINVPIILSGNSLDNKSFDASGLDPIAGADNILGINKNAAGERTYVRVPIGGTALQGMGKFTIEMWIKPGSDNSSDPSIIGDKDWDSGGNQGFVICRSGNSWKINFANQNRDRYDIGYTGIIEDEKWHHIAVTFDKTKECIVYQDGEQIADSKLSYKATDDMTSPFNYICLAQEGTQSYGGGSPNWSGSYNEIRIWTDVLPHDIIKKYMNLRDIETGNHPYLNSLNLYLKMDELKGTTIEDFSGKGNNGELMGTANYRNPYYSLKLTDIYINILNHLRLNIDDNWDLDGNGLKVGVPYRLFKIN